MDLITYLTFDGQCETAFKHYEKVLRGKILAMHRYGDAPPGAGVAPGSADRIMHVRLEAGGAVLMGADAPSQFFSKPQGFSVSINLNDPTEAERIFHELAEGGAIKMPIGETFWAERFGMIIDRFGIPWMVNCERKAGASGT